MSLPSNVHVSKHPCLLAKLSQLRSKSTSAKETKSLIHEIAFIVGCEALASAVEVSPGPKVRVFPFVHPIPFTPSSFILSALATDNLTLLLG